MRAWCLTLCIALVASTAAAQQTADMGTDLSVSRPLYGPRQGPIIAIDAKHNNFHTADGRYAPFASVLANGGYRVVSFEESITPSSLQSLRVLVVANPLAASNVNNWKLPTPSAFTDEEVEVLRRWVSEGGALWLIADHMPFAGAAQRLASAFGIVFDNVYAVKGDGSPPEVFSRSTGELAQNDITRGRRGEADVTEVQTFTGSSFRAPPSAIPIMTLDETWTLLETSEAGKFDAQTPRRTATKQDYRGAALIYGRGRVVVVSEAAFLTNQLVNGAPYGFERPSAKQNKQLLLNIAEWLSSDRRR